jgi:predicted dehydrogenase
VVVRGARSNQDQFEMLPVPDDLWDDVDRSDFFSSLLSLFVRQPIGDRLFIDGILEGRPPSPSFHDGLKAQEVIDAAIESHRSGTWVSLV